MSRLAFLSTNYEDLVRFYFDHLGLTLVHAWDRPNGRGTILSWRDGFQVEILDAAREKNPLDLGEPSDRIQLVLEVEGLTQYLEKRGLGSAKTTSWGPRMLRIKDPDGNSICFLDCPPG